MRSFKEYLLEAEQKKKNNTRLTQVATTGGTYHKTGQYLQDKIPPNSKIISIGAGLDHTRDALHSGLGKKHKHEIHDMEPNPEGRKKPPEYTDTSKIPHHHYNAVVSHNVLNVVEPQVRELVMHSIFNSVKVGGHAIIGTRKWTGDIALAKNYELGDEPKSMWVKKRNGEVSYQKGFDGNELKEYVEDYAARHGYDVTVKRLNGIAANSVHVTINKKPHKKKKG